VADNDGLSGSVAYADGLDTGVRLVNNLLVAKDGQDAMVCSAMWDSEVPSFEFNNVVAEGGSLYLGACDDQTGVNGNISAEPRLLAGDFHLDEGSPCIDAGTSAPELPASDLDGEDRVIDGNEDSLAIVDIGADEFGFFDLLRADVALRPTMPALAMVFPFQRSNPLTPVVISRFRSGDSDLGSAAVLSLYQTFPAGGRIALVWAGDSVAVWRLAGD